MNLDYLKEYKEKISIYLYDLDLKKDLITYDIDTQMVSASTIKVLIMLKGLKMVEEGKWSLSDSFEIKEEDLVEKTIEPGVYNLETLIFKMITESHNITTNILIREIGFDAINDYAKQVGLEKTSLNRYMLDYEAVLKGINNFTSQKDLCLLFEKLYDGLLLNETQDFALNTLLAQKDHRMNKRFFKEPLKYAHKTGDLDHLHHDVGILYLKDKHYYLGISIYNTEHPEGNYDLHGQLAKKIIEDLL